MQSSASQEHCCDDYLHIIKGRTLHFFFRKTQFQISLENVVIANALQLEQGRSQDFTLGGARKLSAEGARIEAPEVPSGVGKGEGVSPSPTD